MRTLVGILLLQALLGSTVGAQEPANERLAREATNQSTEADRLFKLGEYAAALPLYRAERNSREKLGDLRYEAFAQRGIGCCLAALGELEEAIPAFEAARDLDIKRGDPGLAGYDDLLLARTQGRLGQSEESIRSAEAALPRLTGVADREREIEARLFLMQARLRIGEVEAAESHRAKVQSLSGEADPPALHAETGMTLALIDRDRGRMGIAFERMSDARDAYLEADLKLESLRAERYLAEILVELGRLEAAAAGFERLVDVYSEVGEVQAGAENALSLASLQLDLKEPLSALGTATRARASFQSIARPTDEIAAIVVEAEAHRMAGHRAEAYETVLEAIPISEQSQSAHPEEKIRLNLLAAELASQLRRRDDVDRHLSQAHAFAIASKDSQLQEAVKALRESLTPKSRE